MNLDLTGKLALVTGSTRGIGLATATGLAQLGAEVIFNGREATAVADAIAKIKQAAPAAQAHAAVFDLGGAEGCAGLVAQFPEVDILVNNLGIYEPKAFFDIEDDDWIRMFEVNVMSGVRLTRHYLKRMLDHKEWGRVVFVSSESAVFVPKEMVHYGFSKAAQLYIARGVAAAALCCAGRDREPDLLPLLEGLERYQWCCPARRWRPGLRGRSRRPRWRCPAPPTASSVP